MRSRGVTTCTLDGCNRPYKARGYCSLHVERFYRTGDTGSATLVKGDIHFPVGNVGAHHRVTRLWGRAGGYNCVECGRRAADWAYDGTDPQQLLGPNGTSTSFYSRYPEFYMPMCKKCHVSRDKTLAQAELLEYRLLKSEAKLSHEKIRELCLKQQSLSLET